jgi:hypothetical protein
VEIVSKNTSLYVQQCCGKKCFKLWCVLSAVQFVHILTFYMCNKGVHLLVIRISTFFKVTTKVVIGNMFFTEKRRQHFLWMSGISVRLHVRSFVC